MKTPREKYENDVNYRSIVDLMVGLIDMAHFTPSEVREAAVYACILYERLQIRPNVFIKKDKSIHEPTSWDKSTKHGIGTRRL